MINSDHSKDVFYNRKHKLKTKETDREFRENETSIDATSYRNR